MNELDELEELLKLSEDVAAQLLETIASSFCVATKNALSGVGKILQPDDSE